MESPVANSVTSQPRATNPSAMLPATVSHAPYCRGGVRQATGDKTAILLARLSGSIVNLHVQRGRHLRLRAAGIGSGNRRCQIVDEAGGNRHVSVGHRKSARRIVA